MEWFMGLFRSDWLKAVPLAVVFGSVFSMIGPWLKSLIFGSRHSEKNWTRGRVQKGGKLMFPGCKLSRQDTAYSEGYSRAVYFMTVTGHVHETVGNIRYCFLRSYVAAVWAYNQWENDKKVGQNLMEHLVREFSGMGLKECVDECGNPYWEPVPVADVLVPELCLVLPTEQQLKAMMSTATPMAQRTVVHPPVASENVVSFSGMEDVLQVPAVATAGLLAQVARLG